MNVSKRIKQLRESAHLTQQEMADILSISRSTLAGYETENKQPSYQVLIQLANTFHVPTDYILGVGIFEDWDLLLENKDSIIQQILMSATMLTTDVLNNADDILFAQLVYAFNVKIHKHADGVGFTTTFPNFNHSPSTTNKNPNQPSDGERLLSIYNSLSKDDKIILLGKALELKKFSVATDESLKKTGTDNLGK